MILISDLLKLNQVRSVLTVSPSDLPDSVLEGYGLEDDVTAALDQRLPTWAELSEERHARSLRLYVKYKAAAIVATMAPVFVLKKQTDGSNEGQRSDRDGLLWLSQQLHDKAEAAMNELLEDLGVGLDPEEVSLVGKSVPDRDPITEPRDVS